MVGVITRKDLMGFNMEEMLRDQLCPQVSSHYMTQSLDSHEQVSYTAAGTDVQSRVI